MAFFSSTRTRTHAIKETFPRADQQHAFSSSPSLDIRWHAWQYIAFHSRDKSHTSDARSTFFSDFNFNGFQIFLSLWVSCNKKEILFGLRMSRVEKKGKRISFFLFSSSVLFLFFLLFEKKTRSTKCQTLNLFAFARSTKPGRLSNSCNS